LLLLLGLQLGLLFVKGLAALDLLLEELSLTLAMDCALRDVLKVWLLLKLRLHLLQNLA
jgi:hypothetical protein